jgi:hypothetical protein
VSALETSAGALRLALPAALCLLVAGVAYVVTEIPAPRAENGSDDSWRLPQRIEWKGTEEAAALAQRIVWEGQPAPAAAAGPGKPRTPPDWRIVATVVTRERPVAVIRVGNDTPYELGVGDALPGGAIIRAIEADRLQIELNGKRRYLSMPPR